VRVPFADLGRSTAALSGELDAAIAETLESGRYVLGDQVSSFEQEFAAWSGAEHCAGVASGTDAIELALRALGVGSGDEVVTQANTCVPTVAGIERAGATPVLCDVEPDAATIDPASLAAAIGPQTKAVVPVHLYGQIGDIDAVIAAAGQLPVIEDCAQAHGARWGERRAGTTGAMGAFSFYPTKNLGAIGDGGAVVTADESLAERLKRLRVYGQSDRYTHTEPGVNSRLDELQAAILRVKLGGLEAGNRRRAEIAAIYTQALEGTGVRPLAVLEDRVHVFHLYVVRALDRPAIQAELEERGIGTLIHYPLPIHRQPAYEELGRGPVPLTNSEALCDQVLSLPMYPELDDAEVEFVATEIRRAALSA
jgi:dTDP-4-amino-4,6-dideoxygalactose transaminase